MPHPPRLFPGDVELGKRDDDHKPGSKRPLAATWSYHRIFLRRSYKKIFWGLLLLIGLYYFYQNIPTDLGPRTTRPNYDYTSALGQSKQRPNAQAGKPEETTISPSAGTTNLDDAAAETKHWFNGPIKFYELASSLGAIKKNTKTGGPNVRHVVFVASNVKSAGILLPLACEMATYKRNHVHFAFLGRNDISLDLMKEMNGVKAGCNVWFHDGRPDFLLQSSDFRMEVSSSAALGHIDTYMDPQAVIIDNSGVEDLFFLKAMRDRASMLGKTLIELPTDSEQSLRWITRLDSSSLKFWNKVSIDIVIHAQPAASGSLIRLLNSLSKADYSKYAPPRLTIELPHDVDEPTKGFLEDFRWPPSNYPLHGNANQLNLRHRIPVQGVSVEESAIKFLESFWPMKPTTSHLLVLSPQVELSSLYFQYLRYFILEYKYSIRSAGNEALMGISLDLPSTYLNDTAAFSPPKMSQKGNSNANTATSFLWQAPNSNAILYFGNMWTELHSFLGHSLTSLHKLGTPTTLNSKEVSRTYPSWLEDVLRLARTRGYYFLYSALADEVALATVHNELYKPPEEFFHSHHVEANSGIQASTDFTADPAHHLSLQHAEKPLASKSLLNLLPSDGVLSTLADMPLVSWDGKFFTKAELDSTASSYRQVFRREIGGCSTSDRHNTMVEGTADDLFCLSDADMAAA